MRWVYCAGLLMPKTARSHGSFDNAVGGWSHAARRHVTYKKELCENCFCDFHFDSPPFVVLENQFEQGSGNMAYHEK